jgi:hypothetical protein
MLGEGERQQTGRGGEARSALPKIRLSEDRMPIDPLSLQSS